MRKKILVIAPFHKGIGGAETYLYSLLEEGSKKHFMFLASLNKPPENWQGTPIRKMFGICRELLHDALRYRREDIDTIDCHGLQAALVGVLLRYRYTFKLCVTMLALYDFKDRPWWFRLACRWILNHADVIFVEGEMGKQDLVNLGIPVNKCKPFMHWVDLDTYKPAPRKHKGLNILYVGRPIPIKGKHIIEEVERKLFYLKDLHFRYIENCPHRDLIKHYQWADILVVPSQYSEGFPRVVFEGAACGCAILTSDRGALPELVKNFAKATDDFSGYIKGGYVYREKMKEVQRKSRLYAEKFFTKKNAEIILDEY